jgi:hypothetical protein
MVVSLLQNFNAIKLYILFIYIKLDKLSSIIYFCFLQLCHDVGNHSLIESWSGGVQLIYIHKTKKKKKKKTQDSISLVHRNNKKNNNNNIMVKLMVFVEIFWFAKIIIGILIIIDSIHYNYFS